MNQTRAESLALKALAFVAANPEELNRFIEVTGVTADLLREETCSPEILASTLDFVLSEESLLINFCSSENINPKEAWQARKGLPGFDVPM